MRAKLNSRLESMIELKFWSFKPEWTNSSLVQSWIEGWSFWLESNCIQGIRWRECGSDYFNPKKSRLIYVQNPAARLGLHQGRNLLLIPKEFALKAVILGGLP